MSKFNRYIVDAEFSKGNWVNVYAGNNEQEAIRTANFWDERVNVHYVDVVMESFVAEAAEAKHFEFLTLDEKFNYVNKRVADRIELSYQKALANLAS